MARKSEWRFINECVSKCTELKSEYTYSYLQTPWYTVNKKLIVIFIWGLRYHNACLVRTNKIKEEARIVFQTETVRLPLSLLYPHKWQSHKNEVFLIHTILLNLKMEEDKVPYNLNFAI